MSENNGSTWKETIASIATAPVIEHDVGGKTLRFWPISIGMLSELRSIGRPLAQALGVLFANTQNDVSRQSVQSDDTAVDSIDAEEGPKKVITGVSGMQTTIEAISPEMAQFRADQKERAIDRIVDAFSDAKNHQVVGKIIFDSCRDVFPRRPADDEVSEFMTEYANSVVLTQFIGGIMKANAQALGKLGEQLTDSVAKIVRERMSDQLADAETGGETPTSSLTGNGSPTGTPPPAPPPAPATST